MRDGTINHPMVTAQRDVTHRADGDRVVDHHWPLLNHAEPQDSHVGLADHWQAKQSAEHTWVGDREGAFLHLFRLQLLRTRAFRQIVQRALDTHDVLFVRAFHYRHTETPV